jgi:hypothetical protein
VTYTPRPFDTSAIHLTDNLDGIVEVLVRNTHENWAAKRISQGWRYGPEINEKAKIHSSLVKYDDLTESEKELDRVTAEELLKALIFLGYRIDKN